MLAGSTILTGIVVIALLDIISLLLGLLTVSGIIAASIIGLVVFHFGGWRWFVILLVFLIISSLFTKFKYSQKRELGIAQGKKGARSWINVVANGFASAGFAIGKSLLPVETVLLGFIGAVSAAFADTLSTEIGILSKSSPRLITNLKRKVPAGTSGGISVLGELSVLISTAILTLAVWAVDLVSFSLTKILFVTLVSGYAGTTTDSLLGATFQAKYSCEICGRIVESKRHCDKPTQHMAGKRILDNNGVNFIATWIGAITAILFQWVAF
ncbi:MAG: DUF92 domain-containing protein [Candidatus Bathyarchaeota archaeon]|nr:MAG: DUF92 domain-containing protein [Candidatus Bathyarchaeota archaeon]